MERPVSLQAMQLGLSALMGAALGVWYDVLRAVRRRAPGLSVPADALWLGTFLCAMWLFALYPGGGEFRLFFFLGCFLGAVVWFCTGSRLLLTALDAAFSAIWSILRLLLRPISTICKKIKKFSKKLFATAKKWGTISLKMWKKRINPPERSCTPNEICEIVTAGEAAHSGAGGVCRRYPGVPVSGAARAERNAGRAHQLHHRR